VPLFKLAPRCSEEIAEVRFYADEARALVAAASGRLEIPSVQDRSRAGAVQRRHER
jgi:hypothetical protein